MAETKKKKKVGLKGGIIIALLIVLIFVALIGWITDFMWFSSLSYVSVFLTKLFTQLKIGVPTFIVVTFLAYVYLKALKKGYFRKVESDEIPDNRKLNWISWGLAGAFGIITTYVAVTRLWFQTLQFVNSTDFDIKDPLYNIDISFYVFKLNFVEQANSIAIILIFAFALLTVAYYAILLSMRTPKIFQEVEEDTDAEEEYDDGRYTGFNTDDNNPFSEVNKMFSGFTKQFGGGKKKPKKQIDNRNVSLLLSIAQKQLIIVGILFFVMIGIHFFLKQYDLLFESTGAVFGAGFTAVNITMWMYRILIVLSVLAAIGFAIGIVKKKWKPAVITPVVMICIGLLGTGANLVVQNFIVSPDEINKESKYLERNIEYTQYAYGLDGVDMKPFKATEDLSSEDIANNDDTISNIRINDYAPAKTFYNQTQSIRQYYTFNDVDVDRYTIDGEYTQTFMSAREIDEEKINDTWLNRHLKYTHGYGATLSRVDKITASGQPDMLIDSIPPSSSVDLQITDPEIYFGEMTNDYVLVNTSEDEFDYPDGNSNKYCQYEGDSGIKMNLMSRILFSVKEKSLKMLVSGNINSDSQILIYRNIMDRVQKIMPYLDYDEDPYMVTVDGHLYWIMDAYTATNHYPYSEPYSEETDVNYVRNSIKVVIDAYTGETNYYVVDSSDPIACTFQKIYPKLFKDFDEMPEGLRAHIRYPQTLLNIQATVYQRYHMNDVKVFYQNEDLWQIASEIYGTEESAMTPNYYIMKLPGEQSAEFVNSIPFTPKDKKNLMGLLVARNDGDNYGKLVLYQMPKSKIVYGPMQVEAQIDQNTEISKEFSLWDSSGSKYSRGNLFVIPIEDSLLYVEPVYLEATNSSIPEVKRVIVVYGDNIAYESTLSEALNSMFGEGSATESKGSEDSGKKNESSDSGSSESKADIIAKCQEAYDNAQDALKDGDWSAYGKYMDELEKNLNKLN
ncbi:MAG: UPF0182 family protein [Clostridiales bacterium]|nr:UPF0182 family protein [Clostridiales bacterium]MDD7034972.1 UPF0182 family protein [Bacillota bacterium]MDY2920267.1 UPF0182 family protein [Lentihominibacter sp.]